jgi:zinc D-Ala-D-Ala carboxypeptidase
MSARLPSVPSRALLVAAILGLALALAPVGNRTPAAAVGPLPDCRFEDFLTVPRDYASGPVTLVDHLLGLGKDYAPPDLITVGTVGLGGGGYIRRIAAKDTRALANAAATNGTPLVSLSAYRTFRSQRALYRAGVATYGVKVASQAWARPGHSEHQLGLTVDFGAVGDTGLTSNWEVTPTGAWMAANAWKYGWVMSYPKGKKSITCFHYEPWHYRYVGREVAAAIHDSGLTTREYLWANFTQVDPATGEPLPSQAPSEPPPTDPGPSSSAGPATSHPATDPPAGGPTASPSSPGGAGSLTEMPVFAGLLAALTAVALIAVGIWRRPSRS